MNWWLFAKKNRGMSYRGSMDFASSIAYLSVAAAYHAAVRLHPG
jgi:hypothetical protein